MRIQKAIIELRDLWQGLLIHQGDQIYVVIHETSKSLTLNHNYYVIWSNSNQSSIKRIDFIVVDPLRYLNIVI